nr:tolloid-like protein 1 isoform X3 [Procambarus clarkii]
MNGSARNLSVLRMAFLIVGMVARTEAGSVLQECVVLCSSERRVKAVMADLESKTCLRFMARSEEKPYLLVNVGRGNCWTSSIGYPREKVTINLGLGCRHRARITHELLHALGFLHEHSRPDRDHYVAVNWDNIMKESQPTYLGEEARWVREDGGHPPHSPGHSQDQYFLPLPPVAPAVLLTYLDQLTTSQICQTPVMDCKQPCRRPTLGLDCKTTIYACT